MEGTGRAYVHTGRIFAVQASDRYILPLAEGDDLNPGAPGIADPVVVEGANQLAHPATAANLLRVLFIFKVANSLSAHLILRTYNTAN
jgi:hypothetical protein